VLHPQGGGLPGGEMPGKHDNNRHPLALRHLHVRGRITDAKCLFRDELLPLEQFTEMVTGGLLVLWVISSRSRKGVPEEPSQAEPGEQFSEILRVHAGDSRERVVTGKFLQGLVSTGHQGCAVEEPTRTHQPLVSPNNFRHELGLIRKHPFDLQLNRLAPIEKNPPPGYLEVEINPCFQRRQAITLELTLVRALPKNPVAIEFNVPERHERLLHSVWFDYGPTCIVGREQRAYG
jgi:hypothetical protein